MVYSRLKFGRMTSLCPEIGLPAYKVRVPLALAKTGKYAQYLYNIGNARFPVRMWHKNERRVFQPIAD